MNKIEQGILDAHEGITEEAQVREDSDAALGLRIDAVENLDEEPTENSSNAVKSGGVFTWFGGLLSKLKTAAKNIIGAINELFETTVKTSGNQDISGLKKFIDGTIEVGSDTNNTTLRGAIYLGGGAAIRNTPEDSRIPFAGTQIEYQGGGLRIGYTDAQFFHAGGTEYQVQLKGIRDPVDPKDAVNKEYVDSRVPLSTTPHLWPDDGSEVDLKDGTFGRRWAGAANEDPISFDGGTYSSLAIVSVGGSWTYVPAMPILSRSIVMLPFNVQADVRDASSSLDISFSNATQLWSMFISISMGRTTSLTPEITYNFWVRYTK